MCILQEILRNTIIIGDSENICKNQINKTDMYKNVLHSYTRINIPEGIDSTGNHVLFMICNCTY